MDAHTSSHFLPAVVHAGFPPFAHEYKTEPIDVRSIVAVNPEATFYARVEGSSMTNAGIHSGDIIVIDRSLSPASGDICVCVYDGSWLIKRIQKRAERLFLQSDAPSGESMEITQDRSDFFVFGVVTFVLKSLKRERRFAAVQ